MGIQKAGPWDELPAAEAQLALLGVDSMAHVSGQGVYRTAFTLPDCDGAVLSVETGDCMVVSGTINGQPLPAVNQRSGKVDLTGLVRVGENTLELDIATTLINRLRIAHPLFDGKGGMPAPPAPSASEEGAPPMMGNLEDADYELPSRPWICPPPDPASTTTASMGRWSHSTKPCNDSARPANQSGWPVVSYYAIPSRIRRPMPIRTTGTRMRFHWSIFLAMGGSPASPAVPWPGRTAASAPPDRPCWC